MKGEDPMYPSRYTPTKALTPALSMLDPSNTCGDLSLMDEI